MNRFCYKESCGVFIKWYNYRMEVKTLKDYRGKAELSQEGAAERIAPMIEQAVSTVRRNIISAEREGTESLPLLEAMEQVYGVPLAELIESNRRLRSVQKMLQKACEVCT